MGSSLRHLANIITITRILGVGVIFWLTPYTTNLVQLWAIFIYAIICLTDFFDGWVARKLRIVSDVGKILDPLADKILVLVFLPLLEMQVISSFPVFIILTREFAIMALRIVSAKSGTIIAATTSGKIKTFVTLPICGLLLGRVPITKVETLPAILQPLEWIRQWVIQWPEWVITLLIWSTVLVTIWSFLDYFGSFIWKQYILKFQGDENAAKKSIRALIPNTLSLANLCCGIGASIFAWFNHLEAAVLLVLFGIIFDALDGSLARKLDASTHLGQQLDSNADFFSFGIAPAVVIFKVIQKNHLTLAFPLGVLLALIYYASVHYRLRRFNQTGHSDYFDGLPSPVGAGLITLAAISAPLSHLSLFTILTILISSLMISTISYPHLSISRQSFLKYLQIPIIIFLILTILNLLNIQIARNLFIYEILFSCVSIYTSIPLLKHVGKRFSSKY